MPRINETQRSALGYWWDLVVGAVQRGFTTTETTSLAAQTAKDLGGNITFSESKAIAVLYGYASRMDRAAATFQNAAPGAIIEPGMIATPPYARSEQEQRTYPLYHVKFYYTFIDQSGVEQTAHRTSAQPLRIGRTVADVQASVEADAQAFAAKYGHQLVSALAYQILAV